jgi:hypothetical protein
LTRRLGSRRRPFQVAPVIHSAVEANVRLMLPAGAIRNGS